MNIEDMILIALNQMILGLKQHFCLSVEMYLRQMQYSKLIISKINYLFQKHLQKGIA